MEKKPPSFTFLCVGLDCVWWVMGCAFGGVNRRRGAAAE